MNQSEPTLQIQVDGMTCQHCQRAVENAVQSVEGVQTVDVNLETGLVKIVGTPDLKKIELAVEEEGYQIRK